MNSSYRPTLMLIRRILIAIFSAGWLLPLWLSVDTMFDYLRAEVVPRLFGQNPINSFPFVHFSQQSFTVACIWLAAAVFFWAWRLAESGKMKSLAAS